MSREVRRLNTPTSLFSYPYSSACVSHWLNPWGNQKAKEPRDADHKGRLPGARSRMKGVECISPHLTLPTPFGPETQKLVSYFPFQGTERPGYHLGSEENSFARERHSTIPRKLILGIVMTGRILLIFLRNQRILMGGEGKRQKFSELQSQVVIKKE